MQFRSTVTPLGDLRISLRWGSQAFGTTIAGDRAVRVQAVRDTLAKWANADISTLEAAEFVFFACPEWHNRVRGDVCRSLRAMASA